MGDRVKLPARERAQYLFIWYARQYSVGKIDIWEKCDREIRVDSIINNVPVIEAIAERNEKLHSRIRNWIKKRYENERI